MTVFVNNRDLLTWPRAMAEKLCETAEVIIVDNASTYPPLLDWYAACPFEVIRLTDNVGHRAPWLTGIIDRRASDWYVVTDPDLDLSLLPDDWFSRLQELSLRYSWASKVGLGLRIDDLPDDSPVKEDRVDWESRFWIDPLEPGVYRAGVDTTFALYHRDRAPFTWDDVRTDAPYLARHLPWYVTPETVTPEFRYYLDHASRSSSYATFIRQLQKRTIVWQGEH